ncbi:ABA4-like family protein [Natrinema sp. 1APR25-10V2]|uniref:ABA4-like family protein n=1 Tax=Natrinema sp. 1APR25-10V2 TaxID=2951081 RepID=UPI0028760256|nr:ABA4-like family protein [Natrinema sp. 1APR25-10V2]MDS0474845.1 ABA4-like family protein [Natrinema sp. 1APR25-10V2]
MRRLRETDSAEERQLDGTDILSADRPVREVVAEFYDRNRFLFTVSLFNLGLVVIFTVLMVVDGRMVLGRNVWTKPWKFAASIAIFTATLGWLLPSLSLTDRVERLATYTISVAMTVEITLISTQAARAVPSHFNRGTALDTAIFALMGVTITVSTLVVAYVLLRIVQHPPDLAPAYLWGIRLGMFVFVVASLEGFLMISYGGHAVGAPVGDPGLPLLNWSLTGGDLRIAHFVGLHALQVLPLTGYVAARWIDSSTRRSLGVVGTVAVLYGGLVGGTFVWALLGNPLLSSLPVVSIATIFKASFLLVAPFWVLMIVAPEWDVTERIVDSPLVALPAALLYLVFLLPQASSVAVAVLSPSLSGLATLLATDAGAKFAWAHFLAFDLLVGRWIYRDASRRGIPPLVVSPLLVLTLLFGPVGYLSYCAIRPAVTDR